MTYNFCPNCSIGLNSMEMELRFCQNCKYDWIEEDENEDAEFQRCSNCDGHDACEDFGCAIEAGIIDSTEF